MNAYLAKKQQIETLQFENPEDMVELRFYFRFQPGVNPDFNYTSLKGGTSAGMHEAQSRFFENYVGRSRAFAAPLLKTMASHFRGQLGRVTPNQFYLAVNRAEGSLVRTEADELTYPLHVLVRYEIEQMLFSGEAKAAS